MPDCARLLLACLTCGPSFQGPAATWAEREAACCALLHLQLGFPLDLYAPNEHIQLYWYCHYLLDCQQRAGTYLHNAHPQPRPSSPAGKRAGSSAGGRAGKHLRSGRTPSGGSSGGSSAGAVLGSEEQTALRELEVSGWVGTCWAWWVRDLLPLPSTSPRMLISAHVCSLNQALPPHSCLLLPAAAGAGCRAADVPGNVPRRHWPAAAGLHRRA